MKERTKTSKFAKLSQNQILSEFPSPSKKDANDQPIMLSRILLPSKEFSKSPIGDYATIVVPSWTIMDDKFHKETDRKKYKVLNINIEKTYEVQYNTGEKDDNGHFIKEKIIVEGERLFDAFSKADKQKEVETKSHSKNQEEVQEQKRNSSKNELSR